ncbi:MAG: enoyl-CoA hydratase/isomerase family protein, partial [Chloroflexi bacterium]|nr:enoyl-CoA hydratase/isomerase family protein [Chloroflexota bacterium]
MAQAAKYPKRTMYYDMRGHQLWDQELDRHNSVLVYTKDPKTRSAQITINNPTKLNCFDRADYLEWHRIMDEVEADDDVKSVVLRGAGPCFSTGHNMAQLGFVHGIQRNLPGERHAPQRTRLATDRFYFAPGGIIDRWSYLPKFTIVEAKSYCMGIAMWWILASDLVIASDDAVFGHPAYRWVGASVDGNLGSAIMHLGPKRARKMTMLGYY